MAIGQRRSCSTGRWLDRSSLREAAHVLGVAGDWEGGRSAVNQGWPVVLSGVSGETAVPVLVLDMVRATHEP